MTLPNLFVIGAPKCGTTSLHFYLEQHPEISMSAVKEPWVFAYPDYRERVRAYETMLEGDASVRGESSAVYSMHPHFPNVPERIASVAPNARFVYLVRDPVERALSHFVQLVSDGKESRPLAEALADPDAAENVYVATSRYATQLRRYLDLFERTQLLVVDQDRLRGQRRRVLAEVFAFLDVAPGYWSTSFDRRLNTAEEHRTATGLGRRLRASGPLASARRLPVPAPIRRPLRRLVSQPVRRPALEPELRESLTSVLSDEVAWLREFTGQRFAGWSL